MHPKTCGTSPWSSIPFPNTLGNSKKKCSIVHNRVDCPVPYCSAPSLISVNFSPASSPSELRRSAATLSNPSSCAGNRKGNCSCWAKQCERTRGKLEASICLMHSSVSQQRSGPWSCWSQYPCVLARRQRRKLSIVPWPDIPIKMMCGVFAQGEEITWSSETISFLNHPSLPIPCSSSFDEISAAGFFATR